MPAKHIIDAVREDYAAMKNMIYGEYPEFDKVLDCLEKLQKEIHEL